jgi:hypothetical protein
MITFSHFNPFSVLLFPFGVGLLLVWSALCTGLALWHAARRGDTVWFIVFLFVHTAGLLELFYLLAVAKVALFGTPKPTKKKRS